MINNNYVFSFRLRIFNFPFHKMDNTIDINPKPSSADVKDKTYIELTPVVPQTSFVMDDNAVLAPVEIEVLDASSINQMNFDLREFVEAQAIKIHKIPEQLSVNSVHSDDYNQLEEAADFEEQNILSTEEENLLTKQFLNGELTFSEFTVRMDHDIDIEGEEAETR